MCAPGSFLAQCFVALPDPAACLGCPAAARGSWRLLCASDPSQRALHWWAVQLDVRRISDGECLYKGPIGGSVNNALHIAPGPRGREPIIVGSPCLVLH